MRELFFRDEDRPTGWELRAACATADPVAFMADGEASPLVCLRCPVIQECAAQADANDERSGVWGGVDRRRMN